MPTAMSSPSRTASPHVTDEQVRFFVEQGYLVLEGLVAPAEIEVLKEDTFALARGEYPCESIKAAPAGTTDQQLLEQLLCIHQPHYVSPVMQRFITHPGVTEVLSRIVGAHLPFWDGSVKCMQSMLFVKPPGKQGQAWHQDEIYIPTRDRSLCGAWIAIDDANRENGCLRVIPGSHRQGYLHPQREHKNSREFDFAPESHGFDESQEVLVEVPAGSVVFFNGYLLHRSLKNRSQTYRRALVNHFMNAYSLLPWSIEGRLGKGEGSVASGDNRTVVPVSGRDPYAWKGYESGAKNVWLRSFDTSSEQPPAAAAPAAVAVPATT